MGNQGSTSDPSEGSYQHNYDTQTNENAATTGNIITATTTTTPQERQQQSRVYSSCEWDDGVVEHLMNKQLLGPRMRGFDEASDITEECPICFLHYPSLNTAVCCRKRLCTECFLQLKPPIPTRQSPCPFCNARDLMTKFSGPRSKEERLAMQVEEERILALQTRIRQEELAQQGSNPQLEPAQQQQPPLHQSIIINQRQILHPQIPIFEPTIIARRSRVPYTDEPLPPAPTPTPTPSSRQPQVNLSYLTELWENIFSSWQPDTDLDDILLEFTIQHSLTNTTRTTQSPEETIAVDTTNNNSSNNDDDDDDDDDDSDDDVGARVPIFQSDQDSDQDDFPHNNGSSFIHDGSDSNDSDEDGDDGGGYGDYGVFEGFNRDNIMHAMSLFFEPTGGSLPGYPPHDNDNNEHHNDNDYNNNDADHAADSGDSDN